MEKFIMFSLHSNFLLYLSNIIVVINSVVLCMNRYPIE